MSKQSEAMKEYFLLNHIPQVEVARRLNVKRSAVCTLLSGRDNIGPRRAEMLYREFGFSRDFLLTGEGELIDPTFVSKSSREQILEERLIQKELEIINLKDEISKLKQQVYKP